jgi:predicted dehydrogenase
MATTWSDAQEMVEACKLKGVQLTINHQYRFGEPYSKAKELLDGGAIGDLRRFEFGHSTLFDMGSHLFDLCNWYNDGVPAEWVLAQVDYTEENRMFGTHNENQAIAQWRYENGVFGLASTGRGDDFLESLLHIVGTKGEIEIGGSNAPLRIRQDGRGWRTIDTGGDGVWGPSKGLLNSALDRFSGRIAERFVEPSFLDRAIEDVIKALQTGGEPELVAEEALASQELIFAAWESVRRRGLVDLPLEIDDNPLEALVESGALLTSPDVRR